MRQQRAQALRQARSGALARAARPPLARSQLLLLDPFESTVEIGEFAHAADQNAALAEPGLQRLREAGQHELRAGARARLAQPHEARGARRIDPMHALEIDE